jgi:putative FmdB family regulatory protein
MPTYDFSCGKCAKHFSRMLPMGSRETACPGCGKIVIKQISAPAVHFSGSGFYKTDSNAKSSTNSGSSNAAENKTESAPKAESCESCPNKPKAE